MSTETAFYRINYVISSVCPEKMTLAGENSIMQEIIFYFRRLAGYILRDVSENNI